MLELHFVQRDINIATRHAEKAEIGGRSNIREREDRAAALNEDQLVGQLGQLLFCKYWFGSDYPYRVARHYQNKFPTSGDGGEDFPGLNVDVKTSLMRKSKDPMSYRLLVRPRERHPDWVYALLLLPADFRESKHAYLAGWLEDDQLPLEPEAAGVFSGAFAVPAPRLHAFPPLLHTV